MASVGSVSESCNAVHGNSSASQDKVGSMPAFFQGLAMCLKDPDKKYQEKVGTLFQAWETLASYTSQSSLGEDVNRLTEHLYRDTLTLVLRGEWTKLPQTSKTHLNVILQKTASNLSNTSAHQLCQHVIQLVKSPWDHPTLSKIIQDNTDINDLEALEFCLAEKPVLLTIRLEMLCDSKCEDLALKLVAVCRKCLQDPSDSRFLDLCSASQQEQWLDLHVALLYRFKKKKEEVIPLLKEVSLEDGYKLVKRFIDKGTSQSHVQGSNNSSSNRIWRNSLKIAELASQCLLTTALIRCPPPTCLSSLSIQLVKLQKTLGKSSQAVIDMLQSLVDHNKLITSAHMYILCAALSEEFRGDLKPLCIELYVRAVAVDLNDLEKRKCNPEGSGMKSAEIGLAAAFSSLAELVRANVRICRECALTAFSLHPTKERFDKLMELAALTLEQGTKTDPTAASVGEVSLPSPSVAITDYNQAVMEHSRGAVVGEPPPGSGGGPGGGRDGAGTKSGSGCSSLTLASVKEASEDADSGVDLSDVTNGAGEQELGSPSTLSIEEELSPYSGSAAASLGVSEAVIKDLAVVVHSWRWEVLSWKLGWEELEPLCRRYMADQEKMRSVTKELLFLNIDYSQFKDMPRPERDEFWGIEKGYENCIEVLDDGGERSRPRAKTETKRQKAKTASRAASGSSSPHPDELSERKKVLKKKWMRKVTLSLKTSSDSDSSIGLTQAKTATETGPKSVPDGVKRSARIKASKKIGPRGSSPLVKKLRAIRPDFGNGNHWVDPCCTTQTARSPVCDPADLSSNNIVQQHLQMSRCPSSSSSSSSSSPSSSPNAAGHFAPMLSTLDMNPKVVLVRTAVNSPAPSPIKKPGSAGKKLQVAEGILPYVLLEKLDKSNMAVERTMTNLKSLDMIQVRPPPTAVHMVQLPNAHISSRIVTSNGLPSNSDGNGTGGVNNNGNAVNDHRQEQQEQEEANKAATSSTATTSSTNNEDMPVFTSTASVEISSAPSGVGTGSGRNDSDPDNVTLVSTPSVSIFQVAHRSAGNSTGAVLQPVAAVTGFNPPNPRVKTPAATNTSRSAKGSRNATAAVRPCLDDLTSVASTITRLPSMDGPEGSSPQSQLVATSNGPSQSTGTGPMATKQTSQSGTARSSRGQRVHGGDSGIPSSPGDGTLVSSSVAGNSPLLTDKCRIPLVKYVDLDMVSSPSRPRPGSTTGVRRHSQGSNSNSPDPHRSATTKSHRTAGQNPPSPAINSPQSPALQAPPSPLSFRKQQQHHHHVYRQHDNKVGTGDRLASPSHPSQCSSPFSRPSSRSQDTSPSPSEVLGGSMYPPGYLPYGPTGDTGSNSNHPGTSSPSPGALASRLSNFGGASPSQSNAPNFPAALPKFGQAFGKKSHFDVIPGLGSLSSPPAGSLTTNPTLPTINSMQDTNLQVGRIVGGNNYGDNSRRFPGEAHNPSDEGLGSKLHSLLESALNGTISQSPTQGLPQGQQLVTGNSEMLLSDSAHSISPLVGGMDSQSGSDMAGSVESLSEQLREFESVFEQVSANTASSHLQNQPDPWPELAHPDDVSYLGVGPEFLAPSSTFSESMDVSESSPTSPHSAEGPSSSQPDDGGSTGAASAQTNGKGEPLMQLLTVVSAARQALVDEEKENENAVQSPPSSAEIKVEPMMEEMVSDDVDESTKDDTTDNPLAVNAQLAVTARTATTATRVVVLPAVLTGSIVVSTAETGQQSVISTSSSATPPAVSAVVKTEPSSKTSRNKVVVTKSSPVVSPAVSGNSSPSKAPATSAALATPTATATTSNSNSTSTSSASPAAAKAPQKAHDDEHTVLRVQAILEEYKEQLRNSPDLQNKPAPRRRSNPLPSPNATPKRRKSVQSKVKLLSQHARPADCTPDGTPNASSSADSTPSALAEQLSTSSNADNSATTPIVEAIKSEPGIGTATTTVVVKTAIADAPKTEGNSSLQVLNAPAGIQLSIPVSSVVTSRTAALTTLSDGTATAIPSVTGTTTVTVSPATSTSLSSLTGVSTVPLSMINPPLYLQAGTSGVRQILFPLNFAGRGGASPRFIQVRQVTMGGQPGVISFHQTARFGTPITMRAVAHPAVSVTQPGQQVQQVSEQMQTVVTATTTAKPATVSIGEAPVLVATEVPVATQPVPKSSTGGTGAQKTAQISSEITSTSGTEPEPSTTLVQATPKVEAVPVSSVPATATTTSVLRLVPTVNRVSLPGPSGLDGTALLSTSSCTGTSTPTPPLTLATLPIDPIPVAIVEEDHGKWSDQGTPSGSRNSVDGSVTPVADEKLLNDAETGVSEFLPCADMGPGLSPSPWLSLSDSPIGSQNSSPATSPATFQASSTEEDSNGLVTPGDGELAPSGNSRKSSNRSKILKRNVKPRMVMVRKDHGGMEYRRMSDGEGGPAVIRSDRRPLAKRLANKQAANALAAAAAAAATLPTGSSSPGQPESRAETPSAQSPISMLDDSEPEKPVVKSVRLVIKKEGDISVVTSPKTSPTKQSEVVVVELAGTGRPNQRESSSTLSRTSSDNPAIKTEPCEDEDASSVTMSSATPVNMDDYLVRPRRCTRLQKEEVLKHDSDACHLEGVTKSNRRSSVRTNVKKNSCSCCVTASERRKRTKSEPASADHGSLEQSSPAKRLMTSTTGSCAAVAAQSLTAVTTPTDQSPSPSLGANRTKSAKKYAQRKR